MNANYKNRAISFILSRIQHYDHNKYWKMRKEVISPVSKVPKIVRYYYLYRIKKMDAYNNASMGTDMGKGAQFASPPILYHGLNGIIVSHYAKIGENCTIYQRVTIAGGKSSTTATIGDNCVIGAGAVIIGNVRIGNNVKIGANAVVTKNLPDNCTAVGIPAKVLSQTIRN